MLDIDMLKDQSKLTSVNIPSPSYGKGTIIQKLLEFVEATFPVFQNEFKSYQNSSEEILSERLAITLAYHSNGKLPFIFQKESIQKQQKGQNRKVDIGVFLHFMDDSPFFTFEAKRLPTLPLIREKEYVIGSDKYKPAGGIERYKLNLHGVSLKESAMIAYVQDGKFHEWHQKINEWIDELIKDNTYNLDICWTESDLLINQCGLNRNEYAKFISINQKINDSTIKLYHYFINLTR